MLLCGQVVACGPAGFLGAGPGRRAGLLSVLTCGSVHRPDAHLWLSTSNFARNSSMTHSNIEFASLELQRFWGISKNDRDKLRAKCGWRWCRRRPWAPQPGPVDQVAWLPETIVACVRWYLCGIETAIAFARWYLCGIETAVAFARWCLCGIETAVAFARGKCWFFGCCGLAMVLSVSSVSLGRRAVVSSVSLCSTPVPSWH